MRVLQGNRFLLLKKIVEQLNLNWSNMVLENQQTKSLKRSFFYGGCILLFSVTNAILVVVEDIDSLFDTNYID